MLHKVVSDEKLPVFNKFDPYNFTGNLSLRCSSQNFKNSTDIIIQEALNPYAQSTEKYTKQYKGRKKVKKPSGLVKEGYAPNNTIDKDDSKNSVKIRSYTQMHFKKRKEEEN